MLPETIYYFLAFIFAIVCLGFIQKWSKLPNQKRNKVGLIVLIPFLISMVVFILIVFFKPNYFSTTTTVGVCILYFFLIIVFTAFFILCYNDTYNKKVNGASTILTICLMFFGVLYLVLKFGFAEEKENIINNIVLQTTVTNISWDTHKPYFKDMSLADGQYLPMPEAMNSILQVGDSIYKKKKEKFYTVVNAKTKQKSTYEVKVHNRERSEPQ